MITSQAGFIIATPTKCGTTTLEAVARRHMRNAGADGDDFRIMDWDSPRRQHRMCLPPDINDGTFWRAPHYERHDEGMSEWGDFHRVLLVRNPFTRYMSVYTYLSSPQNYSQWGAREVQGREWPGKNKTALKRPKMTFSQFLHWLAEQRDVANRSKRRGDLSTGKAYRSPWVWTDPLDFSLATLREQKGGAEGAGVTFLHLENLWGDLADLLFKFSVDTVDSSPLHANRSTGWGSRGADPGSEEFWGGVECAQNAFRDRVFNPGAVRVGIRCDCGACAIGVVQEAYELGYA